MDRVYYMIRALSERDETTNRSLYWSNVDGWVDIRSADEFTPTQRLNLNLPIGGIWERFAE